MTVYTFNKNPTEVSSSEKPEEVTVNDSNPVDLKNNESTNAVVQDAATAGADGAKEEKTIIIDGPLSQIYTQALNLAYAKEAADGGVDVETVVKAVNHHLDNVGEHLNDMDDDKLDPNSAAYVYAVDSADLSDGGLSVAAEHVHQAIKSGKYGKVIVSMETIGGVNTKVQALDQLCTSYGASVYYSRGKSISAVMKQGK